MGENKLNMNTKVIAEVANSHQGKLAAAIELANQSIKSGAHAIKFQIYSANELMHPKHKRYSHFDKQSFSSQEWRQIFKKIKKRGAKIYCDVFGENSFDIAKKNNVDGFKIHSSDLINRNLLEKIAQVGNKEVFLSTGGSTLNEISYAVRILKKNKIKPVLMHGYQNYPTVIEDTNLNRIGYFKKIFNNSCKYGYQDHIAGDDEMNFITPFVSMSYGLDYIEKHVTLNRSKKGIDYYSSIEPKQLKDFVTKIKKVNKIFGNKIINFSKSEKKYRKEVKKIWFCKSKLKKGKILSKDHFEMKRPFNNKILPTFIENFTNFKTITALEHNESFTRDKIKLGVTAVILARLHSKRLNQKAIKEINGETSIQHLIKRLKYSKKINNIVLATTKKSEDLKLCKIAKANGIKFFRGDEKNVLKRMLSAANLFKNDLVIRVTGDDILIDPHYVDKLVNYHSSNNFEYSNNKLLPGGTEVEIFNKELLKLLLKIIPNNDQTEYLTYYISKNSDQFNVGSFPIKKIHRSKKSLTLDTTNDYLFLKKFLTKMSLKNKRYSYNMDDVINFLKKNNKKKNPVFKEEKIDTNLQWQILN